MEYDDDDKYELEHLLTKTEIQCASCQNGIHLTEEVFLVRLVQAQAAREGLEHYDVLDDYGNYQYEPHFFEFSCWEELQEELRDMHEDIPSVEDQLAIIECDICGSGVRAWEVVGIIQFGELHCSPRSPNGPSINFQPMGRCQHMCIGCLYHMDKDGEYWNSELEPVPGQKVCINGIYERCWRKENCDDNCCSER